MERTKKTGKQPEDESKVTIPVDEEAVSSRKRKLNLNQNEEEVEWIKITGTLYLKNKKIEAGEKFWARPSEIPGTFRDTIRPVNELPSARPIEFVPAGYHVVPSDQEGFFDIVNSQDTKLNRRPLTKAQAEATLEKLQ